jgi:hypothetical protein
VTPELSRSATTLRGVTVGYRQFINRDLALIERGCTFEGHLPKPLGGAVMGQASLAQ